MTIDAQTVALIVAAPTTILGYLAYRRSQKVDAIAAQAGIATSERGSIQQVIEGHQGLIASLQKDNEVGRQRLDILEHKLDVSEQVEANCQRELVKLNERLHELEARER